MNNSEVPDMKCEKCGHEIELSPKVRAFMEIFNKLEKMPKEEDKDMCGEERCDGFNCGDEQD
jgi:hypothetical protein